mmetsp:Transcript_116194/g.266728  ORF Transcript_116194/g.266728 Transcript_116194/m.266728 type:complete len:221 (-) Transcript_116194:1039-1701(-)
MGSAICRSSWSSTCVPSTAGAAPVFAPRAVASTPFAVTSAPFPPFQSLLPSRFSPPDPSLLPSPCFPPDQSPLPSRLLAPAQPPLPSRLLPPPEPPSHPASQGSAQVLGRASSSCAPTSCPPTGSTHRCTSIPTLPAHCSRVQCSTTDSSPKPARGTTATGPLKRSSCASHRSPTDTSPSGPGRAGRSGRRSVITTCPDTERVAIHPVDGAGRSISTVAR